MATTTTTIPPHDDVGSEPGPQPALEFDDNDACVDRCGPQISLFTSNGVDPFDGNGRFSNDDRSIINAKFPGSIKPVLYSSTDCEAIIGGALGPLPPGLPLIDNLLFAPPGELSSNIR
ncbi:hypothetical protein DERF_004501 [Dermatophagoides farinae]|uniref:Uncharacterized protein n=1 Tax=Dermatophagoides farinae TaxID=6954 RepID=A0A922L582_DERFA|nr:hypothetical protein DERF_004501 [Dermatophagoides farinae]